MDVRPRPVIPAKKGRRGCLAGRRGRERKGWTFLPLFKRGKKCFGRSRITSGLSRGKTSLSRSFRTLVGPMRTSSTGNSFSVLHFSPSLSLSPSFSCLSSISSRFVFSSQDSVKSGLETAFGSLKKLWEKSSSSPPRGETNVVSKLDSIKRCIGGDGFYDF